MLFIWFFTSIKRPANYLSMKYLELNSFTYYTVDAKRPKKLFKDVLHFFLYIINPKKYCTFQLRALCGRARNMHRHLMFCYNEFWIYLHICSLFKSILLYRVNKIMFTATPIQAATFQKSRGWPLNRGRTVVHFLYLIFVFLSMCILILLRVIL